MKIKSLIATGVAAAFAVAMLTGCAAQAPAASSAAAAVSSAEATQVLSTQAQTQETAKAPKYVFLFIGDGMSYVQAQTASYYLGAMSADPGAKILEGGKGLAFMNFPVAGSASTYDSTSFCPDSASTATSIASGHKTYSGVINMDENKTTKFETIAEKLKKQGMKIGVVSTVNLNHATPAAFYAHQPSRNNYYQIGQELIASGFDYFAGGGLLGTSGDSDPFAKDLYTQAREGGYKVIASKDEALALKADDGKALVIGNKLADSSSLSYDNDRADDELSLADYVQKGIEVLDNDKGFFMMVEGGKIDWACHANDAGSTIADTIALSNAVDKAVEFYNNHKDETLIIVTGDHETGGLSIGFAGTEYNTFMSNLSNQKISYKKYDTDFVAKYKTEKAPFETVLADIKTNFGLITKEDTEAVANPESKLILTDYEISQLQAAYDRTMGVVATPMTDAEKLLYGTYEPLSVTITHILNNKSGISFTSYAHTGVPVPVFAQGVGEDSFGGFYDNTDIYKKMAALLQVA